MKKAETETQSTELTVREERHDLTPAIWSMIKEMAPVMHISRLFGVSSQEQAAAIMLKGYELGLPITSSFEFINVIDGKPTLSPRGALALINSKGVLDEYKLTRLEKSGKFFGYSCTMKRGKNSFTATFTLEDAARAQLTEGSPSSSGKRGYGNWEKYPENMAMWRAIGFCADVVCPDITGGMTTYLRAAEQFNVEVDDAGNFVNVIDANFAKPAVEKPAVEALRPELTLNDLVNQYGPEKIMEVNNGMIPASQEEVAMVAEKLNGAK
ncbi:MAG TPA: hypothetical protein DCP32_08975 [Anaerolineaceae bacterium]|nr:hypothetical protein [Anaerolineaceae bacterium]